MTLKQYIDNVEVKLRMRGLKRKAIPPPEFLRRIINIARREVARKTRALQCWNTTNSIENRSSYKIPADCLKIIEVWYDHRPLDYKTNFNMNHLMQYAYDATGSTGTPKFWSLYGGENQETAFIYLYPTPSADDKEIKLQTIQLPADLVNVSSVCELPANIQAKVEESVFMVLMKYRGDSQWGIIERFLEERIRDYVNLRVL